MTTPAPADQPKRTNPLYVVGTVLAYLLVSALSILDALGDRGNTAYKAGEVAGILLSPVLLWAIVFGIARALGKARTTAAMWQIAMWTTGVAAVGRCSAFITRGRELVERAARIAISDSERAGLVVDPTGIRHGLFVARPTFVRLPTVCAKPRRDGGSTCSSTARHGLGVPGNTSLRRESRPVSTSRFAACHMRSVGSVWLCVR